MQNGNRIFNLVSVYLKEKISLKSGKNKAQTREIQKAVEFTIEIMLETKPTKSSLEKVKFRPEGF